MILYRLPRRCSSVCLRQRLVNKLLLSLFVIMLCFGIINISRALFHQGNVQSDGSYALSIKSQGGSSIITEFNKIIRYLYLKLTDSNEVYEDYAEKLNKIHITRSIDYPEYNITRSGVTRKVPLWLRKLESSRRLETDAVSAHSEQQLLQSYTKKYYFLTELLQVRIYEEDRAKWSVKELKQWMHYMFLAGVEHIYLCDHFTYEHEKLDKPLKRYIDAGLVTYIPHGAIRSAMVAQVICYQQVIDTYRDYHMWQLAVDMDEYPFSSSDLEENFLVRYLERLPARVTEVSLGNYLMLGQANRSHPLLIDRITRITPATVNNLVKPIYRPHRVRASIHHNVFSKGIHIDANPDELQMLHYWGARGHEDGSPETMQTIEMVGMNKYWSGRLTNSLLTFDEVDAFGNLTGP